jgi:hypothetical protein
MNESASARMSLRPEELAAVANALTVLIAPSLVMLLLQWDAPEQAVAVAFPRESGRLQVLEEGLPRIAAATVPLTPFAALAAWRTHAIATGLRSGDRAMWRGIVEAVVVGALVPMVLLLRVVVERGLPGLLYASAYGVLGAIAGLAFGVVLTVIAVGVIRAAGPKHER